MTWKHICLHSVTERSHRALQIISEMLSLIVRTASVLKIGYIRNLKLNVWSNIVTVQNGLTN